MQTEIIYLIVGLLIGAVAAWIIATLIAKSKTISKVEFDSLTEKLNTSNSDLNVEKEKSKTDSAPPESNTTSELPSSNLEQPPPVSSNLEQPPPASPNPLGESKKKKR